MLGKLLKKKNKTLDKPLSQTNDYPYYMDTDKYIQRTDDIYEYARVYPYDSTNCDSNMFFDFGYEFICKLAENHNLCYYVEYYENQHIEIIDYFKKNFDNGDIYSIIFGANPLLCIRQSKPSVEIMRKASKAGWDTASGIKAYIYRDAPEFKKGMTNNALQLLGIGNRYMVDITLDEFSNMMIVKYDKSLITFDEIKKAAEEILVKSNGYLEVTE